MSEQFDPTKFKSYRHYSSMLYIDEKATIVTIKRGDPLFFRRVDHNAKITVYRGHIICKSLSGITTFSDTGNAASLVCAFDVRTKDVRCINSDITAMRDAKKFIDERMDSPKTESLTLHYSVETINIPIQVKVAAFRDKEGKVTNTEMTDFIHVGGNDERQWTDPRETFMNSVSNIVAQSINNR